MVSLVTPSEIFLKLGQYNHQLLFYSLAVNDYLFM